MTLIAVLSLLAAVGAAIAAISAYLATRRTKQLIKYLEQAITALRDEAIPLVHDARHNLSNTGSELEKLERLIESTETATNMMSKTSRVALATVTSPIVRFKSLAAGSRRAVSVFRGSKQGGS